MPGGAALRQMVAVLLLGSPLTLTATPIRVSGQAQVPAGGAHGPAGARIELLPQAGATPVATAKTDAEGFFELTVPESGCFRARFQAPGGAGLENPLVLVAEETELLVPLVAAGAKPGQKLYDGWIVATPAPATPPPATPRLVQGKVIDAKGAPVPGALVWSQASPAVPCVKAGADGTFQIRLPAKGEAKLTAFGPGYLASMPQEPPAAGSQAPLSLKLNPAGAITGQVVDAAGRPLARVRITALPTRWEEGMPDYAVSWSRADGRFRLSSLPPGGLYELTGNLEGFAPASLKTGALPGPQPAPVRIVLERGAAAFGRVLDAEGKPVADARLTLDSKEESSDGMFISMGGQEVAKTASDAKGGFTFQHLNPGRFHLRIERQGFAPFAPVEVEVPRTGRVDVGTLTLDRGLAIAGRVIDPRGGPVPGVTVDLSPSVLVPEDENESSFQQQKTDVEGRFRFEGLRRGKRFDLNATPPGYLPASVPSVEAPTPEPLTITLKQGRSLSGRVTGPEGEPVPEAQLSLPEERIVRTSLGDAKTGFWRPLGTTDEEGRFRVQGVVAPGTAELHVLARGYRAWFQSIQVPEDGDVEDLEISLEKASVLEVRALDASGEPVAGVEIRLAREDPVRPGGWGRGTDAEGKCRIEDLEPGSYRLTARSEGHGHAEATVEVKSGVNARDLVLVSGVEVSGRVSDENGDPVPGATLALRPAGMIAGMGNGLTAFSAADGSFRFADVDDGTFRLSGSAPGFAEALAPGEIQVAGQEVRGLELRLTKGARVTGKVLGLDPEEAKSVMIVAFRTDLTSPQPALGQVDAEGRYRIENLGPGDWNVAAQANGRAIQEPLHLAPGVRETVLDLRFPSGFTLSGRVLLDQAPMAGARVMAFTSTRVFQALTGPDGGFRISDLPADHYGLVAQDSGQELIARREVEIAGDQEVTFEIVTGGLRGRISAAGSGAPITGARLRLEDAAASGLFALGIPWGPLLGRTTDGSGAFEVPRISAGLYKITVEKEGFAPATMNVEVSPGAVTPVEIALQPSP